MKIQFNKAAHNILTHKQTNIFTHKKYQSTNSNHESTNTWVQKKRKQTNSGPRNSMLDWHVITQRISDFPSSSKNRPLFGLYFAIVCAFRIISLIWMACSSFYAMTLFVSHIEYIKTVNTRIANEIRCIIYLIQPLPLN